MICRTPLFRPPLLSMLSRLLLDALQWFSVFVVTTSHKLIAKYYSLGPTGKDTVFWIVAAYLRLSQGEWGLGLAKIFIDTFTNISQRNPDLDVNDVFLKIMYDQACFERAYDGLISLVFRSLLSSCGGPGGSCQLISDNEEVFRSLASVVMAVRVTTDLWKLRIQTRTKGKDKWLLEGTLSVVLVLDCWRKVVSIVAFVITVLANLFTTLRILIVS